MVTHIVEGDFLRVSKPHVPMGGPQGWQIFSPSVHSDITVASVNEISTLTLHRTHNNEVIEHYITYRTTDVLQ